MDRRKALAVSVAVALVAMAAAALAANFGLLGLVGRADPVGQLSPVAPAGATVVQEQPATQGGDAVGDDGGSPATTTVGPPATDGRESAGEVEQRHQERESEPEHERDD
jgi:hypothetical protein